MPRRIGESARVTTYRLLEVSDLLDGIRTKYREHDGFKAEFTTVGGREALLVQGSMSSVRTKWAGRLAVLSGVAVDLGNTTAAAALLISGVESDVWALTFGMGFHLLDVDKVDQRFGVRVVVRTADATSLQSLTRTTLDHRSRTDRSSIPAGGALRGFGIGDFGEIVSRLAGNAQIEGLTVGTVPVTTRGSDSLNLPLARNPDQLVSDLDALTAVLQLPPKPELEVVENLSVVKGKRAQELDTHLEAHIEEQDSGTLAVGWPHEQLDSAGEPASYRITGNRDRNLIDGSPTLEGILDAVRKNGGTTLDALRKVKVQIFADSDGEEAITTQMEARRWLVFEISLNSKRYCLFNGTWYALDDDYSQRIADHVAEIFERPCPVSLPNWDLADDPDEAAYNRSAADKIGAVSLDRKLIHTNQHPRGFEACDLITPKTDLVHVKHLPKSASASHLIAQAQVSFEALLYDNEAREKLGDRVVEQGGNADWVADRPRSMVLGFARDAPINASSLFTFTQVTLARLDTAVSAAGGELTIMSIRRA